MSEGIIKSPLVEKSWDCSFSIRYITGQGLCASSFPLQMAWTPELLLKANELKGIIWLEGPPVIGARITLTLSNGEAIYEITGTGSAPGYSKLFILERRSYKLKLAGKPFEAKRFTLKNLGKIADEWPRIAAFHAEVMENLLPVIRVRNNKTQLRLMIDNTKVLYQLANSPLEMPDGLYYIMQMLKLQSPTQQIVRLPTITLNSRPTF